MPGVTKLIINEQDITVRTFEKVEYTTSHMKTKEELEEAIKDTITRYKEVIFGSDTPACMACLDKLRKQQVIDQKTYDQRLMEDTMRKLAWEGLPKNILMDGNTNIIRGQVRCWILKLIPHTGKTNFQLIFIAYIDLKITCRMVEGPHILNDIYTLST